MDALTTPARCELLAPTALKRGRVRKPRSLRSTNQPALPSLAQRAPRAPFFLFAYVSCSRASFGSRRALGGHAAILAATPWEDKSSLTGVPKKVPLSKHKNRGDPISADPTCPFPNAPGSPRAGIPRRPPGRPSGRKK